MMKSVVIAITENPPYLYVLKYHTLVTTFGVQRALKTRCYKMQQDEHTSFGEKFPPLFLQ